MTYVRVTLEALVGRTGKPAASIAKIFHDLISQAASLKRSDPEHLFLADPTLLAHAMKDRPRVHIIAAGACRIPADNLTWSFRASKVGQTLEKRRAAYLDDDLARVLKSMFPNATLRSDVKWK